VNPVSPSSPQAPWITKAKNHWQREHRNVAEQNSEVRLDFIQVLTFMSYKAIPKYLLVK
jgi:hypothetical protein